MIASWAPPLAFALLLAAALLSVHFDAPRRPQDPARSAASTVLRAIPVALDALEHPEGKSSVVPTVLTHGMGDACGNPGFKQLTSLVATRTKSHAFCFSDGSDVLSDTINGFLMPMQDQVDAFAEFVRSKPELAGGFNAMGLSQGNLIIRAFVSQSNDPPVLNFVSIHGPHAGVSSIPQCNPTPNSHLDSDVCKDIDSFLGALAYTEPIQTHLAQANFLRLPNRLPEYLEGCHFLPGLLDKAANTPSVRKNFASLNRLALVMAQLDTMLEPKETAWFGHHADGGWDKLIPGEESPFYSATGLKDLDAQNKVARIKTSGNHLDFTQAELNQWIDTFFLTSNGDDETSVEHRQ